MTSRSMWHPVLSLSTMVIKYLTPSPDDVIYERAQCWNSFDWILDMINEGGRCIGQLGYFFFVDIFKPQWIIFGPELSLIVKHSARTPSGLRYAFLSQYDTSSWKKASHSPFFGHFSTFLFPFYITISFISFWSKKCAKSRSHILHQKCHLFLF